MASRQARWVACGLAAIWVTVYVVGTQLATQLGHGPLFLRAETLRQLGALELPLRSFSAGLRLLTTLFVHVDLLHLSGSLLVLAVLAFSWPSCLSLLTVILIGGVLSSLASCAYFFSRGGISAGPSGALCAALGVALCDRATKTQPLARWLLWLGCLLSLIVGGLLSGGDWVAHLGGLFAGLFIAFAWRLHGSRMAA